MKQAGKQSTTTPMSKELAQMLLQMKTAESEKLDAGNVDQTILEIPQVELFKIYLFQSH